MPPIYRLAEIAAYSLLNYLPFLALAIFPFRHNLRFSGKVSGMLIGVLTVIQLFLGTWAAISPKDKVGMVSAISTLLYAAFYFLVIKKHLGKTSFTLLMLSNLANFTVISAKCLEGILFPSLASQDYRWSSALTLLAVEVVIAIPSFLYMQRVFTPAVEKEPSGMEWKYLWLIPATFYIIWFYTFYGNSSDTGLELALRPKTTLFLLIINVGAFLIYYVVSRLISEQEKTLELTERNHLLAMQAMQYQNLQGKITEARRAKHDVRHHIALLQEYLNDGRFDALRDYLSTYNESLPDDSLVRFCENDAANAVLLYFAQQAKNSGIDYSVKADIPNGTPVSDTDMSVLLGNLLENAVDACRAEDIHDKRIVFRADLAGNSLCITVDNTYTGTLKYAGNGDLLSTKHRGTGLGTKSVRCIAEQYGGVCRFEVKDGLFCASVRCFARSD